MPRRGHRIRTWGKTIFGQAGDQSTITGTHSTRAVLLDPRGSIIVQDTEESAAWKGDWVRSILSTNVTRSLGYSTCFSLSCQVISEDIAYMSLKTQRELNSTLDMYFFYKYILVFARGYFQILLKSDQTFNAQNCA